MKKTAGPSIYEESSGEVVFEPGVFCAHEFLGCAVEDDSAFVEYKEFCAVVDAAVGNQFYFSRLGIEAVAREKEGVL